MTMNLSQQVVSLDLAKRMKELGAPQESLFWWSENEHGMPGWGIYFVHESLGPEEWFTLDREKHISTYTVAELGEMLPEMIEARSDLWDFTHERKDGKHEVVYRGHYKGERRLVENIKVTGNIETELSYFVADTEADARAKMWIYLKENNLL